MAAARYWRVTGLSAYGGGDVELSALQLYEGGGEASYSSVSLLLHLNGANGSTVFTDSSARPKAVSGAGGAAISTAQSKFDGASLALSGSSVLLVTDSADFNTTTGDFTIEMWVRPTSLGVSQMLLNKADGTVSGYPYQAYLSGDGGIVFRCYDAAVQQVFLITTAGGLVSANTWTHLALVRYGSVFTVYVNGSSSGSASYSGALPSNSWPLSIGAYSNGLFGFSGNIDEIRFIKGVARYTANFTPPTGAFHNSALGSSAVRVDQSATLSSTLTPISGSIASLQDEDLATVVRLAAREPGFALQWDFGVGVTKYIAGAAPGSAADNALFLSHFDLQFSDDGKTWTQEAAIGRFPWPGANTMAAPTGLLPLLVQTGTGALTIAASAPVPAHSTSSAARLQSARDIESGGQGTVYGTTKTKGTPNTPAKARVVLLHQRSKQQVRETWSDPVTGAFVFPGIDTSQQFLTLAEDAEGHFRPVAANRLTPEVL